MKGISFDQLPAGTDFYCFGAKWSKVSDGAARLVRAKRRPRKPRRFAADEQVWPVGGVKEILLRQVTFDPGDDDDGSGYDGVGGGCCDWGEA